MFDRQQLLMRGRILPVASAAMWTMSALKTAPGWWAEPLGGSVHWMFVQ